MNTVPGRMKKQQPAQAPLQELSQNFGNVVHDPTRPAIIKIPCGPMPENSLQTFHPVSVADVAKRWTQPKQLAAIQSPRLSCRTVLAFLPRHCRKSSMPLCPVVFCRSASNTPMLVLSTNPEILHQQAITAPFLFCP